MRCDVNVSVRRKGQETFGTRCELKNLNRVRILSMAIDAEIRRQIEILENGGKIVVETRRYDEEKDITYRLRSKEDAPDYRYMPEPDLPPLVLSQVHLRLLLFNVTNTLFLDVQEYIDNIASSLPELPDQCFERITKLYGLNKLSADLLLHEYKCIDYFEKASTKKAIQFLPTKLSNNTIGL